jgi:putative hydrolase of the HAD superfamily
MRLSTKPAATTYVFDLDDTLYAEADFVASGKRAVAAQLEALFQTNITEMLLACRGDFLDLACRELKLPSDAKQALLWTYRNHTPTIAMRDGAGEVVESIRSAGLPFCIVTDGRSITQRQKIMALCIVADGIYVSEEVGVEKPAPTAFLRIEDEWPADRFIYVADNPQKDFFAPKKLGWQTIGIKPVEDAIHRYNLDEIVPEYHPDIWVENFYALSTLLNLEGLIAK